MPTLWFSLKKVLLTAVRAARFRPFQLALPSLRVYTSCCTEFEDDPPYSSDQVARLRHGGQIPWFAKIKAKTKITTATQLGTPTHGVIGLFPAKTCKNVSGHFKSWQPGEGVSVMEDIFSNHIPEATWPTIAAALGEKIAERPLRAETFLAQKVKAAPAASGKKSFRKSSESSRSAK